MAGDESAFPDGVGVTYYGITARAYFAARAMQGMCSTSTWPDTRDGPEIARRAVAIADYLIEALNAPPQAIHEHERHEPFR